MLEQDKNLPSTKNLHLDRQKVKKRNEKASRNLLLFGFFLFR